MLSLRLCASAVYELFLLAMLCAAPLAGHAAEHQHGGGKATPEKMWAEMLAKQQALAVSVAFDGSGRLWRARVQDRRVLVDYSDDQGKIFSPPVMVNPEPEAIAADGDSRPKIALGKDGAVYVSYTQMLDKPFTGDVRFSRSRHGGKSFSSPITVNDNREVIGHRFDALAVTPDGKVYVAWLDKRDLAAAKAKGEKYSGSALYYAVSSDGGATFPANGKLADHACDCCRVAMAGAGGAPVVFWRHVYDGNIRDHAMLKLDGSAPVRVSHDEWRVEACPHHGPALSIAPDNSYHFAWFDNAPQAKGLFYAQTKDGGSTFSPPLHFGNAARQPGHADVLSLERDVYLVWKEFDGENSTLQLMRSRDGGASWDAPRQTAVTHDASDHPQLVAFGNRAFLSWNTQQEGYRLIALDAAP